mmetsp:Transcript_9047/g.18791  ORF Transcript_9047/g.18791 Transcript_9047/m.18791 type:complete len:461 (+) Transcript_9047:258-1640(+)|eukprot:CAMPEP_0197283840 /NCGR_PEP_ID=MMETSP1432-20130617/25133_1 /TAXON_ID=44447 /ORGANISM="Pseudo-nitzschia delicatissima, Strain UNC1205" /LENGTH=460 /DNA_ID=CAMNT_0042750837 /DNA_START=209 /DNA_END=1591 /DNA_ORIENTATION=-
MSDLKKGNSPVDPPNDINYDTIEQNELNTSAPAFERIRRSNYSEKEKVCRICLEEDNPEDMIAPCLCKGGSKWVHRECLDEWRTNERDRAFSKCTECLFEYHLQPIVEESDGCCCKPQQRRSALFYGMVSRDACLGIVLQQIVVAFLGAVVHFCDSDRQLPRFLGMDTSVLSGSKIIRIYYGFGWFAFFIGLGLYGSVVMCTNGCDIDRAIPDLGPPSEADAEAAIAQRNPNIHSRQYNYTSYHANNNDGYYHSPNSSASSSTRFYRRARRRHYRRRHRYGYYGYYYPTYYYYPIGGNDSCCCCCCCNPVGRHHSGDTDCCPGMHSAIGGSMSSGNGGSSSGGSNDGQHILLMILLVVAIVLAVIGFFVGVVIVIVAAQRIVGRHIYLLQKRQLVHEFQVMDLQSYNLDQPLSPAVEEQDNVVGSGIEMREGGTRRPPPSAPVMPTEDVQYLTKLGLIDR